jgi:hypothetical protein
MATIGEPLPTGGYDSAGAPVTDGGGYEAAQADVAANPPPPPPADPVAVATNVVLNAVTAGLYAFVPGAGAFVKPPMDTTNAQPAPEAELAQNPGNISATSNPPASREPAKVGTQGTAQVSSQGQGGAQPASSTVVAQSTGGNPNGGPAGSGGALLTNSTRTLNIQTADWQILADVAKKAAEAATIDRATDIVNSWGGENGAAAYIQRRLDALNKSPMSSDHDKANNIDTEFSNADRIIGQLSNPNLSASERLKLAESLDKSINKLKTLDPDVIGNNVDNIITRG